MNELTLNYIVQIFTDKEQDLFIKFLRRGMTMQESYTAALDEVALACPAGHYFLETDADGTCPYCEDKK